MADEENQNPDEGALDDQALADEWAAALEESGDGGGQDDIDALMNQAEAAAPAAAPASSKAPMEQFGTPPKADGGVSLEGAPNLDVILDIPVTISM